MNLIALFLGLALERLLTQLLHLRETRWLDGWFDAGLSLLGKGPAPVSWLVAVGVVVIPALPVAMVGIYFGHIVSGVLYVLFAALVLVFSLGPRDLMAEVSEYLKAAEGDQPDAAEAIARGLPVSHVYRCWSGRDDAHKTAECHDPMRWEHVCSSAVGSAFTTTYTQWPIVKHDPAATRKNKNVRFSQQHPASGEQV